MLTVEEIIERLKKVVNKSKEEQKVEIEELTTLSGKRKEVIQKQLDLLINENLDSKKDIQQSLSQQNPPEDFEPLLKTALATDTGSSVSKCGSPVADNKIPDKLKIRGINFVLLEKSGKKPFQQNWQKKLIEFDNPELLQHISNGGNYGVRGGGSENLIIIDFDNEQLQNEVCPKLPNTFTVRTGSGKFHKYFFTNKTESFKIFDEQMNTLADIQGEGKQVVAPGSVHPNGTKYVVENDEEINFLEYSEIKALLMPYDKKPRKEKDKEVFEKPNIDLEDDFLDKVQSAVPMKMVLDSFGIDTSRSPTCCPFHSSKGGHCLGFNEETAHCFHCDNSWNCFSFVKDMKNCDFKEALVYLVNLAGLQNEYEESKKKYFEKLNASKVISQVNKQKEGELVSVLLPTDSKLISDFASEIAQIISKKKSLFFRPASNDIIEVSSIKEDENSEEYIGFSAISPERFITVAEKYFIPSIELVTKNGSWVKRKSMSSALSKAVLCSPQMQEKLPKIKRIFNTPIPIIYDKKLCFPKKGYDERFLSWMPYDSPEIKEIGLDAAKDVLKQVYSEFCFQEKQDYTNAIAALLTPFLKGLYPSFSTRSPLFFYMANRERAGKDYCADITGLVHEGNAIQEPPLSNGEKNGGNNNEELRKKILSAMIAGRKRLHFANNRGYIDNAVFEGIITAEKYSDRALGRNEILTLDNEMDFSLSGNVGVGFTADIANRSRFIRLFLDIEDANARNFNNPNLHKWVKENRSLILSALYSLVKNWVDKGMPEGDGKFASFPEWAKICGGIMEAAGYDSPCLADKETLSIGGDEETKDMKILFEIAHDHFGDRWVKKFDIKELVRNSEENIFAYLDFTRKTDQTKFGMKISKFVGRVLSDIKLVVRDPNVRASRQEFMFTKEKSELDREKVFGNLGNFGNPCIPLKFTEKKYIRGGEELPTLPTLPTSDDLEFEKLKKEYKQEGLLD